LHFAGWAGLNAVAFGGVCGPEAKLRWAGLNAERDCAIDGVWLVGWGQPVLQESAMKFKGYKPKKKARQLTAYNLTRSRLPLTVASRKQTHHQHLIITSIILQKSQAFTKVAFSPIIS
jgi:hypothetical protein